MLIELAFVEYTVDPLATEAWLRLFDFLNSSFVFMNVGVRYGVATMLHIAKKFKI